MGGSYSSIQVHIGARSAEEGRAAVHEAVRRWQHEEGYEEISGASGLSRKIFVGPVSPGRWVGVLAASLASPSNKRLDALTARFSRELGGAAVGVQVYDSSLVELRLFHRGRRVCRYASTDAYADASTPPWPASDDLAPWLALLPPGSSGEALREAFETEAMWAEDQLTSLATALGMETSLMTVTVTDLAGHADAPERFLRLRFRRRKEGPARRGPSGQWLH
jgi:hypothetical protein